MTVQAISLVTLALCAMFPQILAPRMSRRTHSRKRPPRSTYEAFVHAAGMVQTRTFRIDAVDLATGAPLGGNGIISDSSPPAAAELSGMRAHRGSGPVSLAPLPGIAGHCSGGSHIHGGSEAQGGLAGNSSAAEQQRYLVPVIDMTNHSTLAAGVSAELRLGASSSGLRFVLVASERSGHAT